MSKGIIVLDVPKMCDQCPIRHPGLAQCQITRRSTSHTSAGRPMDQKKRPNWCPIKPLPEKVHNEDYCDNGRYDKGWNECLDEIAKEE